MIQRYDPFIDSSHPAVFFVDHKECDDGEWVRYDDVTELEAELAELQKRIASYFDRIDAAKEE